ncbi:MAG: polyprenyl synthetase family protein, partial [Bacteroidales bacterium]|nr:polyprenyl synthetase family protein [Bacteroidales bacterium]
PVVHVKWNEKIALLSGDAMSVIAYKYISQSKNNLREVIEVFSKTALEICEGQQYDMNFETTTNVSEEQYLKMIKLKTAVLLAASLKIGAISANTSQKNIDNIYCFGENLGIAFQLQDDLLDSFGNAEIFGKKIGGDIIANKKTYLLIKALELANEEQRRQLNYWISNKDFDPKEKIDAVKNIYEELSVHKHSENLMNKYYKTAFESFDKLEVESSKKAVLYNYALSLKQRDF